MKKITESMYWIQGANEEMKNMRNVVIDKIKGKLIYFTWTVYDRNKLNNLSPNETIEKIIKDLNNLKINDDFVALNDKYMNFREKKMDLEQNVEITKSEIQKTLEDGENKEIFSMPLKWLLRPRLICGLVSDINFYKNNKSLIADNISIWDLVEFCLKNEDWEHIVEMYKGVWIGEVKKINKLFDNYGIKI